MKPTIRVHAVLGSTRSLEPTIRPRNPGLHLPGGVTATRWLSQGASQSVGWPLAVEGVLNEDCSCARHCVLNLAESEMGFEALTDELDPRYQRGLPRILAVMSDVSAQILQLGAKAVPGWVLLDLIAPGEARRVKKVQSWCTRQGLEMALVGEILGTVGQPPTILPYHPLTVIQDMATFLASQDPKI